MLQGLVSGRRRPAAGRTTGGRIASGSSPRSITFRGPQLMSGAAQPLEELSAVLSAFPPVQHAFGYGSGVFEQPGLYEGQPASSAAAAMGAGTAGGGGGIGEAAVDRPMLDFILAVEDPVAWHAENLARHRHHYSWLRLLGPAAMTATAEGLGAGVYFNTLVPWQPGQLIKYGVVRAAELQRDLLHWTTLYCAGRMHKPVATLAAHPDVAAAQAVNLRSALRAALLLLPPRFGTLDLLHCICALSYSGDVRMGLAEDSAKVHRIVAGSEGGLRALYAAPLRDAQQRWGLLQPAAHGGGDAWVRDDSPPAAEALAASLPLGLLQRLVHLLGLPPPEGAAEQRQHGELWPGHSGQAAAVARSLAAADARRRQQLLRQAIHAIVAASSRRQAAAGLLTAGVGKSVRYGWAKLRKAWR